MALKDHQCDNCTRLEYLHSSNFYKNKPKSVCPWFTNWYHPNPTHRDVKLYMAGTSYRIKEWRQELNESDTA